MKKFIKSLPLDYFVFFHIVVSFGFLLLDCFLYKCFSLSPFFTIIPFAFYLAFFMPITCNWWLDKE